MARGRGFEPFSLHVVTFHGFRAARCSTGDDDLGTAGSSPVGSASACGGLGIHRLVATSNVARRDPCVRCYNAPNAERPRLLNHATGCRSHNTGCDGDCDCRSFAALDAALRSDPVTPKPDDVPKPDAVVDEDEETLTVCAQCGGSGQAFHACEGVPGGFSDD